MKRLAKYDLESLDLPVLSGRSLEWFARLLEVPLIGPLLLRKLVRDAGVPELLLADLGDAPPTFLPRVKGRATSAERRPGEGAISIEALLARDASAPRNTSGTRQPSILDHHRAYRSGRADPVEVVERTLSAILASNSSDRPLRAVINCHTEEVLRMARASRERFLQGKSLGPLDGVPVAVKDELDVVPYGTHVGTSFLGKEGAKRDATVVRRLREAGAVLIGKTNMYEIGISPESHNRHFGVVRNPHDLGHQTGGSSSGSAAAVAAGLCPLAIGADGGGSIRVPAALCGVVGLKGTYGRFSEQGAAPLCWSLAHVGPIGATTEDVALAYQLMAGPDPEDPMTLGQPTPTLDGAFTEHLRGVTLGVFRPWFEHATPEIVEACDAMLQKFEQAGAVVRPIEIPGLELMRVAQAVTILSEMATAMEAHAAHFPEHAAAVRINLLAGKDFRARYYVRAQQVRTIALGTFAEVFREVDAIVTPTTAVTAPPIDESTAKIGWSNINCVTELMRFVFVGNLTGLPAISFPVGYDGAGLPIGMQAMGDHFEEALLLRLAGIAEQSAPTKIPATYFRQLTPSQ